MVGFISESSTDDLDQATKLKNSTNSPEFFVPKSAEVAFSDSFLDFDSINAWFEDITIPHMDDIGNMESGASEKPVEEQMQHGSEPIGNGSKVTVEGAEPEFRGCEASIGGSVCGVKPEEGECEKLTNLSCCIEQEMGKVTLVGDSANSGIGDGNGLKKEIDSDKDGSGSSDSDEDGNGSSESESDGSSSSSAASSSGSSGDDEEEEEEEDKKEVEMEVKRGADELGDVEEGEIRDVDEQMAGATNDDDDDDDNEEDDDDDDNEEDDDDDDDDENDEDDGEPMVAWSDVDGDDEDEAGAAKGPIRSANELEVLPPVPPIDVTLQPHHQMLPVGVILSIIGAQIIVEGVEKHNPLSEGSILWITSSRSPLGLVDEIFGPVKNPYYKVRYNSESEVPSGIHAGSSISFVPEFAHYVLNDKDLCKKGYDASGANDEEVLDEAEFSDDEKEAEYRRMQKLAKRGPNDQKPRNKKNNGKKVKNRNGPWRNTPTPSRQQQTDISQLPSPQNQHNLPPAAGFLNHGYCSSSSTIGQGFVGGIGVVPSLPSAIQAVDFDNSNGVWTTGMPFQPPQSTVFPNGFPTNGMPWFPQNALMNQIPMPNRLPFQQQFDPTQMSLHAAILPGEQSNIFMAPPFAPGPMGQNVNQRTYGMGLGGQLGRPSEQNFNMHPPAFAPGNIGAPHQINVGASNGRGRKPYRRGGGRFGGGRGRQQSN